ncbi:NAD(P)-dependent oxidoreductase [Allorhizobium undicola]|uniref:NAD(P)-dependent oxidoreductase n=1 Tax=Allorhizobium undicola TaxID=78527 RepID=UPI000484D985|nr:NAD(P)-dependent oxidoreductase [Allorhizobium undicola]
MTMINHRKIAIAGFGEAARAFASGWTRGEESEVAAFDPKLADAQAAPSMEKAGEELGVVLCPVSSEALRDAGGVFSLVTADCAADAAAQSAPHLAAGAFFFDCNSCSPVTKAQNAEVIEAAGGRYVDVAVMAPVHPLRHRTPLLIAGPHAEPALDYLSALGMQGKIAGNRVGEASAIKMMRSVIIKGLEALTAESMLAARRAGVEDAVIASLQASDPGIDWQKRFSYNLERMMVHGARRAAEMREVAKTLSDYGISNRLATAIAEWQDEIAGLRMEGGEDNLALRLDRILESRG